MNRLILVPVFISATALGLPPATAREVVVLPGVVGPVGEASGVDTQGPGTLTIGNQNINTGNDVGGAITSSAANTASILFSGTSSVTGFVGAAGNTFLNISAGANANSVTFAGPVYSTTFSVSGTGTVNFNGGYISGTGSTMDFAGDGFINVGAGQTIKAAITNTAGANTGTLTLGANSILDGAVGAASGLKAINLAGGNALITGEVKAGTYTLGTNTLNVAGAFAIPVAGTINTTILSETVYGKIAPTGAATIGDNLQLNVTVTGPIANGTGFNIVDAASGTSGSTVIAATTSNSLRYQFSAAPTINGRVQIITTQVPLVDIVTPVVVPTGGTGGGTGGTGGSAGGTGGTTVQPPTVNPATPVIVAPVVDALPVTPTTEPILTAITLLPTAESIADALALLGPSTANVMSPQMSYRATQWFQDQLASYLEESCEQQRETNRRNMLHDEDGSTCWLPHLRVTGFGYFADQGNVNGYEGYESHTWGAMLAYETPLNDATRVGAGFRYASTSLDGKSSTSQSDIKSYQVTAYLGYAPGPGFINTALTYGLDRYSGTRDVIFPGVDSTLNSAYHGHQFTAFGTTGFHFYVGDGRTSITPYATLQYTRLHTNGYEETGDGAINLRVEAQNYDFAQAGLGVKVARNVMVSETYVFRPEIHTSLLHSIGDRTMETTAAFTSGGPSFTTQGLTASRNLYDVGAGIALIGNRTWSLNAVYDYLWQSDDYSAHRVMVGLHRYF